MDAQTSKAPAYDDAFFDADERALGERFLANGHVIVPSEDRAGLDRIRDFAANKAAELLGLPAPENPGGFLDDFHKHLPSVDRLNEVRLGVFNALNAEPWLRPTYFAQARRAMEVLIGNELAMQRRINLSIQLPQDDSSLLPVHSDVWSGDSPFEVVLWIPLVDVYRTKSMFLLPPEIDGQIHPRLAEFKDQSAEDLYKRIQPELKWLEMPYGHVLLFTQNLMHGNRVNVEPHTRWSMNCRLKGLFTPYADKRLGEFFAPITMRPTTRMGLDYRLPGGFDE